jgi:hypothetical protein
MNNHAKQYQLSTAVLIPTYFLPDMTFERWKRKNFTCPVAQCQIFNIFKTGISEISLKYAARSLKNYSVLKILCGSLVMIHYELKHVATYCDILLEIELCLTDVFYFNIALIVSSC